MGAVLATLTLPDRHSHGLNTRQESVARPDRAWCSDEQLDENAGGSMPLHVTDRPTTEDSYLSGREPTAACTTGSQGPQSSTCAAVQNR